MAVANLGVKKAPVEPEQVLSVLRCGGAAVSYSGRNPETLTVKMNKKERRLALRTAFQSRTAEDMIVVEEFSRAISETEKQRIAEQRSPVGASNPE